MRELCCVVNPAAARGGARRVWPRVQALLQERGVSYTARFTQAPGHATELVRSALLEGSETVVVIGGDGTVNEAVNGFFENGQNINPNAKLAVVPKGTGTDFSRTLGLPDELPVLVDIILQARSRQIDVGVLRCRSADGAPVERCFINIADLGYGGALLDRVNGFTKFLGGFLAYLTGMLYTLMFYDNQPISFRIDDGEEHQGVYNAVIVANGQYFGGGMWIAPGARLDDGCFEIVLVGDVSKADVVRNLPKIYRGTLSEHDKVQVLSGRKLEVWSDERVLLDADGELPGQLPAVFELLPAALQVCSG